MTSLLLPGFPGRRRAPGCPRTRQNSYLLRFEGRHQPAVRALAARHERLAELALSFPALLVALAVPHPGFAPDMAISQVLAGVPLKELARQAGLPMWSRRLMPEAFAQPFGHLPHGELVARQIVNHLPRSPKRETHCSTSCS